MCDRKTRQSVLDALDALDDVDASHVGVAAEQGAVTLSGQVGSQAEKGAIEQAVLRVGGVRALIERVVVRPPACSLSEDERLAARLVSDLQGAGVPDGDVVVKVEAGCVTLDGHVPSEGIRETIAKLVAGSRQVRGFVDRVRVRPVPEAAGIKAAIVEALARPPADTDGIVVTVARGTVTLDGYVKAWGERELAEQAAWATPGVAAVNDRLMLGR